MISRSTGKALEVVRGAIIRGDLSPGEQVRQHFWADHCGVSRPPLREALEILTNEGLLTHGLNQGYFVSEFSFDDMNQLYTMRYLLEREVLQSVAWPNDEQIARFQTIIYELDEAVSEGRPDVAISHLVELFVGIYRNSPRTLIVHEIERLWDRTAGYRSISYDILVSPHDSSSRCQQILSALKDRDRAALVDLMLRPTLRGMARSAGSSSDVNRHPDRD